MAEEGTSEYWKKLLKIDEQKEEVLAQFRYPHRILRPILYFISELLARYYFRIEVHGKENLPTEGTYILAPNHCSSLDYPVVACAIGSERRKDLYVLATKYFYDNPFTRFFIKSYANAARIDTEKEFFPALQVAVQVLKSGKPIYIHPEGTRSGTGELQPFRVGVGVLAVEMGVPLVPVYIYDTFRALPTGSIFPKPYKVKIFFGKPITMEAYREKIKTEKAYYVYREVTEELKRRIQELKSRV